MLVLVDVVGVLIMLGLLGSLVAVIRADKATQKAESDLRFELQKALNSRSKATLADFLVLWNDKLTKDQKDAIKVRLDDLTIEEDK